MDHSVSDPCPFFLWLLPRSLNGQEHLNIKQKVHNHGRVYGIYVTQSHFSIQDYAQRSWDTASCLLK